MNRKNTVTALDSLEFLTRDLKNDPGDYLSTKEAAVFLHVKISTIYSLICEGKLCSYKKSGRRYFLKIDLQSHLSLQSGKSLAEIADERDKYLYNKKG